MGKTENNSKGGQRAAKLKVDGAIQEFYSNLTTPIFFCNAREILWHNSAANALFEIRHFRQYILQLDKSEIETSKVFVCEDYYYKILIRPFKGAFFLEVVDRWTLSSTVDSSLSSFEAPEVLDTVARNAAHRIFQAVNSLGKVLEKLDATPGLNTLPNLKYLDQVADATYRMLRATNLYNEYSLLMSGKTNTSIVDIFGEIDALCSTVNSLMAKSEVVFRWSVPDEKVFCDIDMHKFSFSLFHLICNAYMFAAPKSVVKVVTKKCESNSIVIDIIDNGADISPGIIDKIIEPYFSYDSTTGDVAGCGLGLTYASVFVKNSGGTLTISSENGETKISVTMPIVQMSDSASLSSHVVDYKAGKYYYMVSTMSTIMLDI